MMVTIEIAQSEDDIQGIKSLNVKNLPGAISIEEKLSQGFVTCPYTVEDLTEMNSPHPHIVAKDHNSNVVGYCLIMLNRHSEIMPVLLLMFELISEFDVQGEAISNITYFTMGQMCVDKAHRSSGVFHRMYDYLRERMQASYDIVVTEISALNKRSLRAHEKQGFKVLQQYEAPDGHPWVVVYWDWR